MAKLNTLV